METKETSFQLVKKHFLNEKTKSKTNNNNKTKSIAKKQENKNT